MGRGKCINVSDLNKNLWHYVSASWTALRLLAICLWDAIVLQLHNLQPWERAESRPHRQKLIKTYMQVSQRKDLNRGMSHWCLHTLLRTDGLVPSSWHCYVTGTIALYETKTPCKRWMLINMQFSLPAGLSYVTTAQAQASIDNTAGVQPYKCLLLYSPFSCLIDNLLEHAGETVITVCHFKFSSKSWKPLLFMGHRKTMSTEKKRLST